MKVTRKMAGIILVVVGAVFILMQVLAVEGSDLGGLPTLLGTGVMFLMFGAHTTVTCMMDEEECETGAP